MRPKGSLLKKIFLPIQNSMKKVDGVDRPLAIKVSGEVASQTLLQ